MHTPAATGPRPAVTPHASRFTSPEPSAAVSSCKRLVARQREAGDCRASTGITEPSCQLCTSRTGGAIALQPQRGLRLLLSYPDKDAIRLMVDGCLLVAERGWTRYEAREPGSLDSLILGWAYLVSRLTKIAEDTTTTGLDLNKDFVTGLHKALSNHYPAARQSALLQPARVDICCALPLCHTSLPGVWYPSDGGFGEAEQEFRLFMNQSAETRLTADKESGPFNLLWSLRKATPGHPKHLFYGLSPGMAQRLWSLADHPGKVFSLLHSQLPPSRSVAEAAFNTIKRVMSLDIRNYLCFVTPGQQLHTACLRFILDRLSADLSAANSDEDVLRALVIMARAFNLLHPFRSVNGRTAMLMLQYALMAYGYPPATLEDPNVFFLHSVPEMLAALQQALAQTRALLSSSASHGYSDCHGYPIFAPDPWSLAWRKLVRRAGQESTETNADAYPHLLPGYRRPAAGTTSCQPGTQAMVRRVRRHSA
ncbi:MAG: Fic family protein [Kistimonas sp.]|nr:Fic family protein [Kistimonas sp.]